MRERGVGRFSVEIDRPHRPGHAREGKRVGLVLVALAAGLTADVLGLGVEEPCGRRWCQRERVAGTAVGFPRLADGFGPPQPEHQNGDCSDQRRDNRQSCLCAHVDSLARLPERMTRLWSFSLTAVEWNSSVKRNNSGRGGIRTHTPLSRYRILSPVRLPVPPLGHQGAA